jgi:SAM-dependent methyltransferase
VTDPYARLAGVYDEIVVDPCHGRWADHLARLWADDPRPVRTVLDVCCGTGLMTRELIARGYRVVGVDASEAMLARARRRLGAGSALHRQTLPRLSLDGVFDAAVSTLDGLNYLRPADLGPAVAAIGARLRPGGWFVFDLHTDAMMRLMAQNPVVHGESGGRRFTITSTVDTDARTCDARVDVDGEEGLGGESHLQHFFTDAHVRTTLADAGLAAAAVTAEYTDAPVGETTLRATWVARRGAMRS